MQMIKPTLKTAEAIPRLTAIVAACIALLPSTVAAQYTIEAENGDTVQFESAVLRTMLDTARALWADLESDPNVLYFTPAGREPVPVEVPDAAYPWNAVTVINDSMIDTSRLPANLREADRAYYNYAVQRMRVVREGDPDVPCDSLLALEEKVVGSFVDGWILSRTLFGAPPFPPLDELVFARREGLLRSLLARRNDPQVGACAAHWVEENPERVAAYDAWRREKFPRPGDEAEAEAAAAELGDPAAEPEEPTAEPALPEAPEEDDPVPADSGSGQDR